MVSRLCQLNDEQAVQLNDEQTETGSGITPLPVFVVFQLNN